MNASTLTRRIRENMELLRSPLYDFERTVRPDNPAAYDQQHSAFHSKAKITFVRGGTGSGKTHTLAAKCAKFVTQVQEPFRVDTPFVVVSDSYEQVCNICWKEKLATMIPAHLIDKIGWKNQAVNWPYWVKLKPWPNGNNWILEFHSLEQGRRHFQGRSFGGFWFSEQFEWDVFDEVVGRCREKWYDGAHFAEFTPMDPDLAIGYEERMADPPEGWVEYRLNMCENSAISQEWIESYLGSLSEDYREVRRTGEMLHLSGAVFPMFNPAVHVLSHHQFKEKTGAQSLFADRGCSLEQFKRGLPPNVFFNRGIDWGESKDHPFAVVWGMRDGSGDWYIFDEYLEDTGRVQYPARIEEIKDRWPWVENDPHYGMSYADCSKPLRITEFTTSGILCSPASNADGSVLEGIDYIKRLLEPNFITGKPKLYILKENCPNLIKQLRKYRWRWSTKPGKTDSRTNPDAPKLIPLKYKDDLCDAVRYLLFSSRIREGKGPDVYSTAESASRYGLHIHGNLKR